ncbi:3-oxoacyl-[acyl-carrier-protein] reductase [bacterium NHP-B]|nr:3-oxoacyl-[acyl-carrier-protein] reductase [bacterium NHP-B]
MPHFDEKKVLVTGATGGIGEAIARLFHAQGATVFLSGTREEKLTSLQNDLRERVFGQAVVLTEAQAPDHLITAAASAMDGLDIVVNNAGITCDGLLMRMGDEEWDRVLDVNLRAVMQLCRASIKEMMKQRFGRIINVSSVVAAMGNPGQCNYVASKAGLEGFSKSLAVEVASRGITVNCVAPGFIETPMTAGLSEARKEALLTQIPLKRMGTPEDIAHGTVFLASEGAAYITGAVLPINGGMWRG